MEQPEGFVVEGKESLVCKLKHSLYGLKQSPRCWNSALDTHLKSIEFVQSSNDPCIYTAAEGEPFIMGVYVDDIVLASNSSERVQEMKDALAQKITIRDLGELKYFLGVQITQDASKNQVWIGQPTFTELLLSKYGLSEAKPTNDLTGRQADPTLIFEDNQSIISMAKNPTFHGRTKHIGIKYHFIREQVSENSIRLEY